MPKWDWRAVLTDEERRIVDEADRAKEAWLRANERRAGIMNRAINRAKYRALASKEAPDAG